MAKKTLKDRMKEKLAEQKAKGSGGAIYFLKADTEVRVRILNMGDEEEFIKEITQFYLGSDIKGVISPVTFGEPCGIDEAYKEFSDSSDDDEKEMAAKFPPRKKYLAFCAFYKDLKGKDLDTERSPRFILLSGGSYQDILELYLDDDDWGDMTDPKTGYDIKIKRTGSGKQDTEYSVKPCQLSKTPKQFAGEYDLEEEVRKIMPTYEETKVFIEKFLGLDPEDEDDKPKKKKKKIIKKKKVT